MILYSDLYLYIYVKRLTSTTVLTSSHSFLVSSSDVVFSINFSTLVLSENDSTLPFIFQQVGNIAYKIMRIISKILFKSIYLLVPSEEPI